MATAAAIVGSILAILAGFCGRLAPVFDSFAHFRAHLAIALILVSLVGLIVGPFAVRALSIVGLVVAGAAFWTVFVYLSGALAPSQAASVPPSFVKVSLLQMNVRAYVPPDSSVQRIRKVRPDLVTIEELNTQWFPALKNLSDLYPYQATCNGVALLSKRPFVGPFPACTRKLNFLSRTVALEDGVRLSVASIHLPWPWPREQWRAIGTLSPVFRNLPHPLVIAGDFNAAPWSAAVAAVAKASGTTIEPSIGPSWLTNRLPASWKRYVGLPIDNVLTSPSIEALSIRTLPPTQSDHLPVLVEFAVPRTEGRVGS